MIETTDINENGLTFPQWYAQVDRIVISIAGLGIEDLADGPSWDSWNDGMSPQEYAEEQLVNESFPFE